jgi:hypothetical protein
MLMHQAISMQPIQIYSMNNVMHDIWYRYGFDETSRNFQQNNYGKGGKATDFVYSDAQDGSKATPQSVNNANFYAPVDGTKPRMQMFYGIILLKTDLL